MLSTYSSDFLTRLHKNKEGRKRVMQSTKNVSVLVRFTLMKAHLKRLETSILDTVQKPFVKLHP